VAPAGVSLKEAAAPDGMRLYAIGDVHGRADLLRRMHERIDAEIARDRPDDWRVVHLGDYVDRGPDSRAVIEFLIARMADDARNIALMGNHDERFAMFLRDVVEWPNFQNFGGRETAASYGVEFGIGIGSELLVGHRALARAVPASHVDFLDALPYSAAFGDFFFCHAGIRPGVPLERQSRHDLVWIREEFHRHQALHPKVVVHGHTPVPAPQLLPNRVNLDTMAYESGVLTALVVEGREKRLMATRPGD
jgi:serine/threonine protein phosphatase 1